MARISADRAYCPPFQFGEMLAGCALQRRDGELFRGSAISTWSGFGKLSPLEVALVSLGAHGFGPRDIASVVWTAAYKEASELRDSDKALLSTLAPDADFVAVEH
eukprot:gnl/TRDRNA2_/TRDRNA2_146145_c1_seq1.p3 gnl/TRDRNA2_/TRDRNA2_146145_c1~~gnl/TRDRNA2_/TRDRNA2_146145_c1_seq1.p3  ORF type:complete len:105 (-),score=13.41 gnl/TRDRNA2_/TRDRNA2_146145_c1_seq1:64-378(-)